MSAPSMVSRTPAPNETNVYLNKYIEIAFNQPLSTSTINDNTIIIYRISDYNVIDKKITYDAATYTITLAPEIVFDQNTQYNVVIVGADQTDLCLKNATNENLATSLTGDEEKVDLPTADSPVSAVLEPAVTTLLSIKSTRPENYSANLGTINGDFSTVHWDGPIMVTFDRPVASGVSVLQEWMTFDVAASDGDPATPTGMPSGLLYNTFGDSLTWVPYTYDANNYNWKVNNEITVTISDHVKDATGAELGTQYRFMFTTAYRPYYCTIPKIRSVIGAFIREVPDDTIARQIFFNSLEAYNISNTIYSQYVWDMDHPTFAAQMWVCCKTQYDLLYSKLLDMASVGPGMMKRLGDFSIQESTDIQAGVKGALQKALDCTNAWLKLLLGKYRRAKAKMAIKGVTSPATPPMRGVRTWTLETGRDTLGANKTLTRRIKSPGIYSEWS
jgi:hypothetical protein